MQGMQGMSAAQGMQQGRGVPSQISDLYGGQQRPPMMQGMQGMQGMQAPARFRKGGEAKKKAAAQGRMAKPAGRGRTTKPAVRGRMAKPTRGKK